MNLTTLKAAAVASTLFASLSSHAAFPVGQWQSHQVDFVTGDFINDVPYCLRADGTFYEVDTPTQGGYWHSDGKEVLMRFAYSDNSFTGSYSLRKTKTGMSGYGQSWFFPDASGGFNLTATWTRLGNCR